VWQVSESKSSQLFIVTRNKVTGPSSEFLRRNLEFTKDKEEVTLCKESDSKGFVLEQKYSRINIQGCPQVQPPLKPPAVPWLLELVVWVKVTDANR
jgi:hypothetical protein